MKSSYKIALLLAAGLSMLVVGYYVMYGGDDVPEPVAVEDSAPDASAPAAQAEGASPAATPAEPAANPAPADDAASNPLMEQLRARQAAAAAAKPTDATPAATASEPVQSAALPEVQTTAPASPVTVAPVTTVTTDVPTVSSVPLATTAVAATPQPLANRSSRPATYTVKAGDTLTSIAGALYGQQRSWVDIAQANPLVDPRQLQIGQVLRLPGSTGVVRQNPTQIQSTNTVIYTVRPRDTLYSIARKHYNDSTLWRAIFNANRAAIGNNPNNVPAGMRLVIPPAQAAR
jgi:nucleoid-associated protein YgaU